MIITVKIYATLRLRLGLSEVEIIVDNPLTMLQLLEMVNRKVEDNIIPDLITDNQIITGTMLLIDGKNVLHAQKLDTIIDKECEVSVFPPVAGG